MGLFMVKFLKKFLSFLFNLLASFYILVLYSILILIFCLFLLAAILGIDWLMDGKINFSIWQNPYLKRFLEFIESLGK